MNNVIAIDASVAFKWIVEREKNRNKALLLYKNHTEGKETIIVPRFILLEIANALVTKSKTTSAFVQSGLEVILEAKLSIYKIKDKDILKASRLAKKYKTTVYDMLYAVIAKNKGCDLITADKKFIEKTGFKFAKHISEIKFP